MVQATVGGHKLNEIRAFPFFRHGWATEKEWERLQHITLLNDTYFGCFNRQLCIFERKAEKRMREKNIHGSWKISSSDKIITFPAEREEEKNGFSKEKDWQNFQYANLRFSSFSHTGSNNREKCSECLRIKKETILYIAVWMLDPC